MPVPTVAAMLAVLAAAGAVAIWWPVARAIQPSQSCWRAAVYPDR